MTTFNGTTKETAEAFSLHAEAYDKWFDEPQGRKIFELEVRAVRLLMRELTPPFLEIGAGSGRFGAALGIRSGVEPSEALLKMAQRRGIKVERAFGEKLPFPNGIFGGVFLLFTLCFVSEPSKVIAEAERVLKNDGRIIIGIINRESQWGRLYLKKKEQAHPIYRHARFFNVKEVAEILTSAGFSVEMYSSTLCNPPTMQPYEDEAHAGLMEEAGFICIRAKKCLTGVSTL